MNINLAKNSKNENHLALLSSLIANSEKVILCSGWIKPEGLQAIKLVVESAVRNGAHILIISNKFHTKGRSAEIIAEWPNVEHLMATKKHGKIHSKIYYFQSGNKFDAIIGSANITKGGLLGSDELSVHIQGKIGDKIQIEIKKYLEELCAHLNA
jgi:HKD family nuclease